MDGAGWDFVIFGICCFAFGNYLGILVMCLLFVAKRADEGRG